MSVCVQVLLVAGGWKNGHGPLSSTEVLTGDSPVWTKATPLPRIVYGVASVTLDNTVFISGIVCWYILYNTILYYIAGGKGGEDDSYRAEVLAWSDEEQDWVKKGKLQLARSYHATTTIRMDSELMEFCG